MFNKYNLIIILILLSSFVFGYKGDVISSSIKSVFSKKEPVKTVVEASITTKEESSVNPGIVNSNPLSPVAPPLVSSRPQSETLGKTLDSINAGSISEEQLKKHQEYLKNITTKLKDFQGGEENVPPSQALPPALPDFAGEKPSALNNAVIQPVPSVIPPQPAPGSNFEQQTPFVPQEETAVEEDDSEDEEVEEDSSDDEDPEEEDTSETDDAEVDEPGAEDN